MTARPIYRQPTPRQAPPCPIAILDAAEARQWRDEDGNWLISIPRQNDRPSVAWAIEQLEKAAEKHACVIWTRPKQV